jgi:hypothetical protein
LDKLEEYDILSFKSAGNKKRLMVDKVDTQKIIEEYPLGKTEV